MIEVREIGAGETAIAAAALLALRPQWGDVGAVVDVVDTRQRPAGYRLVGAVEDGTALSVAGFRVGEALSWGRFLYVDDLSTLPAHRGAGLADQLMDWLDGEARRLGCAQLHLDSGVGADRAAAHRLYMRHHLRISAHHFQREL